MNEEIIKILDYIGSKFGVAIDWTDKNVMPYLQELADKYINYELVTSIAIAVVCVFVIIWSVYTLKTRYNGAYESEGLDLFFCVLACIGIIFAVPFLWNEAAEIIRCITFPEMQIYEYLSRLIQK